MALINGRLLSIQVPDYITRQQRNIGDYKHWKGDYQIFLRLCHTGCVPCENCGLLHLHVHVYDKENQQKSITVWISI